MKTTDRPHPSTTPSDPRRRVPHRPIVDRASHLRSAFVRTGGAVNVVDALIAVAMLLTAFTAIARATECNCAMCPDFCDCESGPCTGCTACDEESGGIEAK